MRDVGEMRSSWWWDSDGEVGLVRHPGLCGDGRSLGIRNEARTAGRLVRFQRFYGKAPPSTVDHKGETTTINNDCNSPHSVMDVWEAGVTHGVQG